MGLRLCTFEEEPFGSFEELVLHFGASYRVKPPNADDLFDHIPATIVGVRVRSQDPTQKSLKPQAFRGDPLVSAFVYTVAFDAPRYLNLNTHVKPRERIVAAMGTLTRYLTNICCLTNQYSPETILCVLSLDEYVSVLT